MSGSTAGLGSKRKRDVTDEGYSTQPGHLDTSDDFFEGEQQSSSKRKRDVTDEGYSTQPGHLDTSDDFFEGEQQSSYRSDDKSAEETQSILKGNPYDASYLSLGFTWTGDPNCPAPFCIVCRKEFANSSMCPSHLKRHLRARHSYLASKSAEYFQQLLEAHSKQSQRFISSFMVDGEAVEASYLTAELIAQKRESYKVGKNLIMPACKIIVSKLLGQDAVTDIENVSLSHSAISRRVKEMSHDIEEVLCEKMKNKSFSLKVHVSTDFANKVAVITFVRFVDESEIQENFFSYNELPETSSANDIFSILSSYMKTKGLSWKKCVGFCAYSTPSVADYITSLTSLVKGANQSVATHFFSNREMLVSNTLGHELKKVLDDATEIVNFIKQTPTHSRMFKRLVENLDKEYVNLLLQTDARWLSRGTLLYRLYQMKGEMYEYLQESNRPDLTECFEDEEWLLKLVYLADLFHHISQLNASLQGREENILTSCDKIVGFKRELDVWKDHLTKGNLEMFPQLLEVVQDHSYHQLSRLIIRHLEELENTIEQHFPFISTEIFDWVRNPCSAASPAYQLTLSEEEELCRLQADCTLPMRYAELSLDKFWISVKEEYPAIHRKAVNVLLQFSSSYTCDEALSWLAGTGSTGRNSLVATEDEMRVSLSRIRPRIKDLCSKKIRTVSISG